MLRRGATPQLFEGAYPLIRQRLEVNQGGSGTRMAPRQVGKIVLKLFGLLPVPSIPPNKLPQSLDEGYSPLRNVAWHKVTLNEEVLTQHGAGCSVRNNLRHFISATDTEVSFSL